VPRGDSRSRMRSATGEVEPDRFALHALRDGIFEFERMLE
jgi:hypothetical protein